MLQDWRKKGIFQHPEHMKILWKWIPSEHTTLIQSLIIPSPRNGDHFTIDSKWYKPLSKLHQDLCTIKPVSSIKVPKSTVIFTASRLHRSELVAEWGLRRDSRPRVLDHIGHLVILGMSILSSFANRKMLEFWKLTVKKRAYKILLSSVLIWTSHHLLHPILWHRVPLHPHYTKCLSKRILSWSTMTRFLSFSPKIQRSS